MIDPISKKHRSLDEWGGDADLFMFEKCIRGDRSDNVQSSYPRLRKTKIVEAFDDEYLRNNIMENEFTAIVVTYVLEQAFYHFFNYFCQGFYHFSIFLNFFF